MTSWITHLIAFMAGAGVGLLLGKQWAGRRAGGGPGRALRRLYKQSPNFFNEFRIELSKPEYQGIREFAILESSRVTFVSEDLRFVFYEEDMPGLKAIAEALETNGLVDDVTRGKTPIFRIRENFIDALKLL